MLLDKNIVLAGKKRTRKKRKVYLRKKRRCTKKIPSIVGLEPNKIKSDNAEGPGSKVLNADSIIRPISELSNTDSEKRSDSTNKKEEKSGNKLIRGTETRIIYSILIGSLLAFLYLSTSSKIVNAMILKLPDIHLSANFETILWTTKERVVFKIDSNTNNCIYSLILLRLQGWVHSLKC